MILVQFLVLDWLVYRSILHSKLYVLLIRTRLEYRLVNLIKKKASKILEVSELQYFGIIPFKLNILLFFLFFLIIIPFMLLKYRSMNNKQKQYSTFQDYLLILT